MDTATVIEATSTPNLQPKKSSVSDLHPEAIIRVGTQPTDESLNERFRPIFEKIAEGAIEREQNRVLPFVEVELLRKAGFPLLRIPVTYGGLGATLPQFFRLLLELAEADSNVSHLFRGHFSFLEGRLNTADRSSQEKWFRRVAEGAILGYAMAERTAHTGGDCRVIREGEQWFLDGTKYYSTGTIYADWIIASAFDGEERLSVAVPTTAAGVTRIDDWDGFGQRLTGSGTTRFERVPVSATEIIRYSQVGENFSLSYQKSFLQLVLLTSMVGAGRAALKEGLVFVKPRTRAFGIPGKSSPKDDPLVQRVIGRVSSLVYSAQSLVETVARDLEQLYQRNVVGEATESDFLESEIRTYQAQQIVIAQILDAVTTIFEVGGASATSEARRFDRHWRNVRTAASHNPAIHREKAIGDYLLNGTIPDAAWRAAMTKRNSPAAVAVSSLSDSGAVAEDQGACRI